MPAPHCLVVVKQAVLLTMKVSLSDLVLGLWIAQVSVAVGHMEVETVKVEVGIHSKYDGPHQQQSLKHSTWVSKLG